MGMGAYRGVSGVARKVTKMYRGVSGVARNVKKGYRGVSGVARQFFGSGNIYHQGDECTYLHGGFVAYAYGGYDRGGGASNVTAPIITRNSTTIVFTGHGSNYGSVFTRNKIDLTNYSTMKIKVTGYSYGGSCRAGFTTGCYNGYTGTYMAAESTGTLSLNISSLSGSYYFALEIDGANSITISEIILE